MACTSSWSSRAWAIPARAPRVSSGAPSSATKTESRFTSGRTHGVAVVRNTLAARLAAMLLWSCLGFVNATLAYADAPQTPAPAATDAQAPRIDDSVERMLKDMAAASTWGHPDLQGEFGGMLAYAKGDYKA